MNEINFNFLNNILYSFETKINNFIKEGKLKKEDERIENFLNIINQLKKDSNQTIKNKNIIEDFKSLINDENLTPYKIGKLYHQILHSLSSSQSFESQPIPIVFICDLDSADCNGTMLTRFCASIEEGHHVTITTPTLLNLTFSIRVEKDLKKMIQTLNKIEEQFDLYQNESFVIFVPKKMDPQLIDLHPNTLKQKIKLEQALKIGEEKPTIEGFKNLFSSSPSHDKLFYIAGHGLVGNPAGLNSSHYEEFIECIQTQRCQGLLVSTCYGGGKSQMHHLAKKSSKGIDPKPEAVPFPVLLRSIGDFPSIGNQKAEKETGKFLSDFHQLMHAKGGMTIPKIRGLVQTHEKGKKKKHDQNLLQVYLPYGKKSIGGFRAVGEDRESYPLTAHRYRLDKFEHGVVQINNKKILEISSPIIECPIKFEGIDSLILSLIPGQSLHLLKEIHLDHLSPLEFLKKTFDFHREIMVNKTLFIGTLGEFNQVFVNLFTGQCGFRHDKKYYLCNLNEREEHSDISEKRFSLIFFQLIEDSFPNQYALEAATGASGLLSTQQLLKELRGEIFWGNQKIIEVFNQLFDKIEDLNQLRKGHSIDEKKIEEKIQEIIQFTQEKKFENADCIELISYLMSRDEDLACELLEKFKLNPNANNFKKISLIAQAANHHCLKMGKMLIERGVDLNIQTPFPSKKTPLSISLEQKNIQFTKLLLKQEAINIYLEDNKKNPAFFSLFTENFSKEDVTEIYDELKKVEERKTKSSINMLTLCEVKNILSLIVNLQLKRKEKNFDSLEFLLNQGLNPNSALISAIQKNDKELIELLLRYQADPLADDGKAILTAMTHSSLSLVKQLINISSKIQFSKAEDENKLDMNDTSFEDVDELDINLLNEFNEDSFRKNILIAAIKSADEEKIEWVIECLKKQIAYPQFIDQGSKSHIKKGITYLLILKKFDLLNKIFNHQNAHSLPLFIIIEFIKYGIQFDKEILNHLSRFFSLKKIDLNPEEILLDRSIYFNQIKEIIKEINKLGANLDEEKEIKKILDYISKHNFNSMKENLKLRGFPI